jgi:hypothetical protein
MVGVPGAIVNVELFGYHPVRTHRYCSGPLRGDEDWRRRRRSADCCSRRSSAAESPSQEMSS